MTSGLLEGCVAIVTGAARGIGAATCRAMIDEGATVVVADVQSALAAETATRLGDRALPASLDVRDEDAWARVVAVTLERFGAIDVLVNNAGILRVGDIEATDAQGFMEVIEVNVLGTFLGIRAVTRVMKARGRGVIVNLSSTAAMTGANRTIAYTTSKWAIRGLTKVAAAELGASGIRVNSVHPGPTQTAMNPVDPGAEHDWSLEYPLNRIGQPEDVANMVTFLASNRSSYSTGAEFVVDGGRSNCTLIRHFASEPD